MDEVESDPESEFMMSDKSGFPVAYKDGKHYLQNPHDESPLDHIPNIEYLKDKLDEKQFARFEEILRTKANIFSKTKMTWDAHT